MQNKTMLEKILNLKMKYPIIEQLEQKEFAEIVKAISLEIFTRSDIETLRNLEAEDE